MAFPWSFNYWGSTVYYNIKKFIFNELIYFLIIKKTYINIYSAYYWQIPGIDADHVKEPFIDVCVGGTEIPGGESENFSVWAITILGRVSNVSLFSDMLNFF